MSPWKLLLLPLYYYGSQPYRRRYARQAAAEGRLPVVILFYHRIADDCVSPWSTSARAFTRQIDWLKRHFEMISLVEAQERIRRGNHRPCVSITFDDGYADNCRDAIPLLIRQRVPCTYFVTLENMLTGMPFQHDLSRGCRPAPNNLEQIRAMAAAGVEIGIHARTHANLAAIGDPADLEREVVASGRELGRLIGRRVRYFACPFGRHEHLSSAVFTLAKQAGYEAVCSAYGGYNHPGDDPFHLQRFHGDEEMIRLRNRATIDPRLLDTPRFAYRIEDEEFDVECDGPRPAPALVPGDLPPQAAGLSRLTGHADRDGGRP